MRDRSSLTVTRSLLIRTSTVCVFCDYSSDKVQTNAAMTLHVLTGFPAQTNGGRILSSQIPEYFPKWQEWIEKNPPANPPKAR